MVVSGGRADTALSCLRCEIVIRTGAMYINIKDGGLSVPGFVPTSVYACTHRPAYADHWCFSAHQGAGGCRNREQQNPAYNTHRWSSDNVRSVCEVQNVRYSTDFALYIFKYMIYDK